MQKIGKHLPKAWNHGLFASLLALALPLSALPAAADNLFLTGTRLPVGTSPVTMVQADFNGDGRPDIATANLDWARGTASISVLLSQTEGGFAPAVSLAAPTLTPAAMAFSLVAEDFNGDGRPDLVGHLAAEGDDLTGMISVFLNHGAGDFAPAAHYLTGGGLFFNTADFNNDGLPDIVSSLGVIPMAAEPALTAATDESSLGLLSVLMNNGDGTLAPAVQYQTNGFPVKVATGDLDGNGWTDMVVNIAGEEGTGVSVLLNQGNGRFAPAITYPALAFMLEIKDLNGDGKADIVTAGTTEAMISEPLYVLLNRGDGTFAPAVSYKVGRQAPASLQVEDLNNDGKADIIIVTDSLGGYAGEGSEGRLHVLLNQGDGTFAPAVNYPAGLLPHALTVHDLNGDSQPDLLLLEFGSVGHIRFTGTLRVFLNKGDGTFARARLYAGGSDLFTARFSGQQSYAVEDFNGDGRSDIAVANVVDNTVILLFNEGNGRLTGPRRYATGASLWESVFDDSVDLSLRAVDTGDFDGDGRPDIAVANSANHTIGILRNTGNGEFAPAAPHDTGRNPVAVAVGDMNGDGRPDLVSANAGDNTVGIHLNAGTGNFAPMVAHGAGNQPFVVAVAEVNGDGRPDLVVADHSAALFGGHTGAIQVLLNTGEASLAPPVPYADPEYAPLALAVADLNNDGRADIAAACQRLDNTETQDGAIGVRFNNGDGTFAAAVHYAGNGFGPLALAMADLNNDGWADIAAAGQIHDPATDKVTGIIRLLFNNGDGRFAPPVDYGTGNFLPVSVTVADHNGDGRPDLAVAVPIKPGNKIARDGGVRIFLNNGEGSFTTVRNYPVGGSSFALASTDFNDDGKADLALRGMFGLTILLTTDREPLPYAFVPRTGVEPNRVIVSNRVEVAGLNTAAPISIAGGEYSLNGGAFTAQPGRVEKGDRVRVRVTAAGSASKTTSAVLKIGGVRGVFKVTTR